jgi:hypothetical protein
VSQSATIRADAFFEFSADTFLRVFDAAGNQLAFNDNANSTTTGSSVTMTLQGGTNYLLGVSTAPNTAYNPNNTSGRAAGGTVGSYLLFIDTIAALSNVGVARTNSGGGLTFSLDRDGNHAWSSGDVSFNFGLANDIIVVGDWNNDLASDLGVARPNGTGGLRFSLDSNGNLTFDGSDAVFNFGLANDRIIVGDWDGDGDSELGVARPNGTGGLVFSLDSNGNRAFDPGVDRVFNFGLASDIIVVGDWDGNGIDELGVARPNGTGGLVFSLDSNGNLVFDPGVDQVFNFGLANDRIVVGDWNASGVDKLGVARPNTTGGLVYSLDSNGNRAFDPGVDSVFNFGLASDRIVTGSWSAGNQVSGLISGFASPSFNQDSGSPELSAVTNTTNGSDPNDSQVDPILDEFALVDSSGETLETTNTFGNPAATALSGPESNNSLLNPDTIDLVFSSERSRPRVATASLDAEAIDEFFGIS